ncbi:MAG TPA: PKD domain-containing protein, partial [Flavobacteriales bacterium]|nr:PKD domain-containing protein [Flavobacteriales bacterium]
IFTATTAIAWDFGSIGVPTTAQGDSAGSRFSPPGIYPVTVTYTEGGCTDSYTDSVVVYPRPVIDFTNDDNACVGASFSFDNLSTAWTPIAFTWSLGDGTIGHDSVLVHTYAHAGVYNVSLSGSTNTGCIDSATVHHPAAVHVFPQPVAAFTALPVEVSIFDPHVTITDYSSQGAAWNYFIEGEDLRDRNFEHWFDEGGQYTITQVVTSDDACTDTTTRVVTVSDHVFYAPSAFTPDGDDKNDVWLPVVKGARHYELRIFDRWGEEVFHTEDTKQGWSGDGRMQGVYLYTARVKEWGSDAKDYIGSFSLLR